MNFDRTQRQAAFERLHVDCERFWAQTDVNTYSVSELIDRFLNFTDSSLPDGHRLIFLAHVGHLGWHGVCQVFEYMLADEPDLSGRQGTYSVWIGNGMQIMKDAQSFSVEDRVRVAENVESIIERAAQETNFSPETTLGYFYYEHPLRVEQPQLYLLKSKEWFERAIETGDDDFDFHDFQTVGHVYFELGDFKTALHWYNKFDSAEDRCGDACVMDRALAQNRLIQCQRRLTGLES